MKYGTTDAVLKPLNEVLLPDPRFKFLKLSSENDTRSFELADMHQRLCELKLNLEVPKDAQTQFQTALNLMLYTWFVFEFHTVAEQHAYGALEFALRQRFPQAVRRPATASTRSNGPTTRRTSGFRYCRKYRFIQPSTQVWSITVPVYDLPARGGPVPAPRAAANSAQERT